MKKNKKAKAVLPLILSACILLSGCTMPGNLGGTTGEKFDAYMDELFREEIAANTINLHYTLAYPENYGITDYEVSIGNFTLEGMEQSYEELKELREDLLGFDVSKLTESQLLTYDVVMDYVETELMAEDLILFTEVLSPTTGYQAQLPVILAEYTFRTERDIEDYLELVAQMDDIFAEIVAFEELKSEAGLFMPDYAAEAVIEQCEEFIEDPENNYMIEIFDDKIDAFEGISEEEKESYKEQNYELITTDVVDGYRILIDGLTALKGTGTNELGLCYYENGTEYYEYLVRTETGSNASVEELQKRTEEYIDSCMDNMLDAFIEDYALLDEIYDYSFPITDPEEILQDLTGKVSADFPEPPEVNYTIKYVHPSLQENLSPAFYLTTPVDDIKNNVIYINEKYLGEDSYMDLYPTLAHEGYPGHLYQNSYTNSCDLPLVRNLFSYSGYSEGWATYVEFYSYYISGLDSDLAEVLMWNQAASLGLYAYVDMGVNYDGWDREDVAEYLASYGFDDEEIADEIFEVMVEEPANYLSYFVGYMEFWNLRKTAEYELGDDFVAKDFHQFILESGPAPFYVLQKHMTVWLEEQKGTL